MQNDAEFKEQFGPYIRQLLGLIKGLFGGQEGLIQTGTQSGSRAGGLGDFPKLRSEQDRILS